MLAVVAGQATDPRLHQVQSPTVREVLRVGLKMALEMHDALQERLKVLWDLGRDTVLGEEDTQALPRHRPGRRDPVLIAQLETDERRRYAALGERDGLLDHLGGCGGHPLGFGERVGAVGTGPSLPFRSGCATWPRADTRALLKVPGGAGHFPDSGHWIRSVFSWASTRNAFPSGVIR